MPPGELVEAKKPSIAGRLGALDPSHFPAARRLRASSIQSPPCDIIAKCPPPIDLWCSFYPQITSDSLLTQYQSLMTEAELAQATRFYFEKDRRRYTVTRALTRTTLSRYVPGIAARDWRFETNQYGRPHIVNDEPAAQRLSFNITHTDGLIILAVTSEPRALGIDAENTQTRPVSPTLADSFFAPEEAAVLKTVDAAQWQPRFFEYWTLKESYIKARGMGLSIPLDKFSFRFPQGDDVELYVHPEQNDSRRSLALLAVHARAKLRRGAVPGAKPAARRRSW